ncbi:MAG: metallophosphoesterase [Bacteroidetes bacterium]|nr:metallophosphoesterase [Bacteroidota bacterium]
MRVYFPILFSMVVIAILSGFEILLLKKLHRDWWQYRKVRQLSYGIPLAGIAGLTLWALGVALEFDLIVTIGASLTTGILVLGLALMISLPLSGVFHAIDRFVSFLLRKRSERRGNEPPPDPSRRRLLTTSAAAFPILAIAAGGKGLATAYSEPRMPVIPLHYPDLPAGLEGLRILHITDVHIGLIIGFDEVERMVELSAAQKPDLVLLTGDFSDDADSYLDALRLAGQIPARYGGFASIGNHEYFRGIKAIVRAYEKGPIPLFINSGTNIDIGGTPLYIAGVDDPRSNFGLPAGFFERGIDVAMRDAPSNVFSILMCHRPNGFDAAAQAGIPLTLSGHTHGGQIGFNGRSLLYATNPEKYMWGQYQKNGSQLYVSSGAGHWFPYRLGCPTEIPLYVLTSIPPSAQE